MAKRKKNYYAVRKGRVTGIYSTWDECKAQTNGYSGALFKGFECRSDAEQYMKEARSTSYGANSDGMSIGRNMGAAGISRNRAYEAYSGGFQSEASGIMMRESPYDTSSSELDLKTSTGYHRTSYSDTNSFREVVRGLEARRTRRKKNAGSYASSAKSSVPLNEIIIIDESSDDENVFADTTTEDRSNMEKEGPSTNPTVTYSKFAHRMMAKMGHVKGKGLGKSSTGIVSPIKASKQPGPEGSGLGFTTRQRLNTEQTRALEMAKSGSNVFLTGPAGTGKSFVLHQIIQSIKKKHSKREWVAVGPTGVTAIALGGQTIHSFAGVGVPQLHKDFGRAWKKRKDWRQLRVLIIDEISMLSGEFLDCLSSIVCDIRGNDDEPFGGLQLIVCGDFLQLPPIHREMGDVQRMKVAMTYHQEKNYSSRNKDQLFLNRGFAFQANCWKSANFDVVQLEEVFRQDDSEFVRVLHELRKGDVTEETMAFLQKCVRPLPPHPMGILPTILHSKNKDVTMENMRELHRLPGNKKQIYTAVDNVTLDEEAPSWAYSYLKNHIFFKNCIAEKMLTLKVGAQVMLIKNERPDKSGSKNGDMHGSKRLVNGSRGKVIGFEKRKNEIDLCDSDDDDNFDLDLTNLSKAEDDNDDSYGVSYPVVQFVNGARRTIHPEEFDLNLVGIGTCTRQAIPLKLAWALTAHKSQGMTLDYVIANVGETFADAQAYVALSRASGVDGLEIRNFSRNVIRANPMARMFYDDPENRDNIPHWVNSDME